MSKLWKFPRVIENRGRETQWLWGRYHVALHLKNVFLHCESEKTGPLLFLLKLWQMLVDFKNYFTVRIRRK